MDYSSDAWSRPVSDRLRKLEARLRKIQDITGIPAVSVGVIHQGVEVWKFNRGVSDVENQIPVHSNTVFNLNSLTKGITAAAFARLVKDGKITWETPIKSVLPDFAEGGDALDQSITHIDLLSMRTGYQSLNCLAWQGNNIVLPNKSDTVQFWNATPRLGSFRSHFSYINWAYGIIALVKEKLSGKPLHHYFQEYIFDPLNLKRTKMQDSVPLDNSAASYAVQDDRTPVRVLDLSIGAGVFTEGGSRVLSTIDDMLCLYFKYLQAINDQFHFKTTSTTNNPFFECTTLLAPHNFLPTKSIYREQSYGCGWIQCQLPGPLGMIGVNADNTTIPNVLEGGPSHLCLYHMGMMVGSTSNIALIPETETVVAILANATPLGDGSDCMSQMIMEEIFEPPIRHNYEKLAEEVAIKVLSHIPSMGRELEDKRVPETHPSFPPEAYAGTFVHDKTPFKMGIRLSSDNRSLALTFMGQDAETYELQHYQNDVFTW